MAKQRVTAVFDIGRTNKKFFLFDEEFQEVHREYVRFAEVSDEDGYPTEDLPRLQVWLREVFDRILEAEVFDVQAINFSSYGATLVHLDADGKVITPLYNYTKPYDAELEEQFYATYGPEATLTARTGSSRSGMLNAGLQLYWLKYRRPEVFGRIRYSLHLPQFLSYVFTGIPISEYTSIGCHTALWDYRTQDYHAWVYAEELHRLLPPIVSTETSINMNYNGRRIKIGVGIHDSSAALLPYIRSERKPFVLISTGTWSVTLNPFGGGTLTPADLQQRCINYMRIDGKPVKAARLFLGEEYQRQVAVLNAHFGVGEDYHRSVRFDFDLYTGVTNDFRPHFCLEVIDYADNPARTHIEADTFEQAYHQLLVELVRIQVKSIRTAIGQTEVVKLFLDGGFSDNDVFLHLLGHHFRGLPLRTTDASLGSALGAAICISDRGLNSKFLRKNYGLKKHQPFIIAH